MEIEEAYELVENSLSPNRLQHTLSVVKWALELSKKHGVEEKKAHLAALLHDLKKEVDKNKQLEYAKKWGIIKFKEDLENPHILHGPLAAYWLEYYKGYKDKEVLRAIAHHTLGAPGMGILEMLIYSADLTEETRNYPQVDKLRQSLYDNLEQGTLACMEHTIAYLKKTKRPIHPQTRLAYEDLKRRTQFAK
ncbi:MAG: HD domain-containing protein [Desulfitobacterium sp.]|nr:HD domain-containing protein [Desulfitobacterium sp.]